VVRHLVCKQHSELLWAAEGCNGCVSRHVHALARQGKSARAYLLCLLFTLHDRWWPALASVPGSVAPASSFNTPSSTNPRVTFYLAHLVGLTDGTACTPHTMA
jgi:hypothetical protein